MHRNKTFATNFIQKATVFLLFDVAFTLTKLYDYVRLLIFMLNYVKCWSVINHFTCVQYVSVITEFST